LQLVTRVLIAKLAAVHFQEMARRRERSANARQIGADRQGTVRQEEFGNEMTLCRALAGEVKFALQVLLSDLQIAQSHADVFVPQQLHEGGKTDP